MTPRKTPTLPAPPPVENQVEGKIAPNRFRRKALRRLLIRYGVFLGGAAALLWIVYADRALIGGRDLYTLPSTNPKNFVPASAKTLERIDPAVTTGEFADPAKLTPLIERASATRPEPALDQGTSIEAAASADATARSSKPSSTSTLTRDSPSIDTPSEGAEGSLPIYRTVRQILLREEPRFGAAAEIMLDRGARLIVLEIDGRWLKVKMEKTGAPGFVREEFVVPASAAEPSRASKDKSSS